MHTPHKILNTGLKGVVIASVVVQQPTQEAGMISSASFVGEELGPNSKRRREEWSSTPPT